MGTGIGGRRSSGGVVLAGFVVLVVLAGGNAVAIRVVNRELDPLWGATLRFSLAAAGFAVIVLAFGLPTPSPWARLGAALYGLLFFAIGFGLVHWALTDVGAGLAQTLLAATPLFTVALAWAQRLESLRWSVVAGSGLAFGGVALIFSHALPDAVSKISVLAVLAAAACWAQAGIVVKRFPPTHPAWMNAIAMAVGTVGVFTAALLGDESLRAPDEAATWMAIAYLVVPGTLGVFGLYVFVLRNWDASVASFRSCSSRWSRCRCPRGSTTKRSHRRSSPARPWCSPGRISPYVSAAHHVERVEPAHEAFTAGRSCCADMI